MTNDDAPEPPKPDNILDFRAVSKSGDADNYLEDVEAFRSDLFRLVEEHMVSSRLNVIDFVQGLIDVSTHVTMRVNKQSEDDSARRARLVIAQTRNEIEAIQAEACGLMGLTGQ
jgi:hypothetical protein